MIPLGRKIILASASPRRQQFMHHLGLEVEIIITDIDETPLADEMPLQLVERLAANKAQATIQRLEDDTPCLIVAADTVVALEDTILGKPANPAEATQMLTRLRDRAHQVYSSVSLLEITPNGVGQQLTRVNTTDVRMRCYSDNEIHAYVASGDPMDKAGAYAIQNASFAPVQHLSGCVSGVIGLPLAMLRDMFTEFDVTLNQPLSPICDLYTNFKCCMG